MLFWLMVLGTPERSHFNT